MHWFHFMNEETGELVDINNDTYKDLILIPDLYAAIGNQAWCYIFLGDKNGFSDIQFDKLLMITDNSDTRELLNKMLVGMYETNTTRLVEINTEIEKLQGELRSSITEINETEHDIRELEDDESTIKRKSQIELNEIRRTEYQNYHLIIVLSISLVALLLSQLSIITYIPDKLIPVMILIKNHE